MYTKLISILILIGFTFSSFLCSEDKPQNQNTIQNKALACFQGVDTTQEDNSIGCVAGFYKLIDSNLVIKFTANLAKFPYDKCQNIDIDSSNGSNYVELFIYKDGEANLSNICTDLIMMGNKQPLRSISPIKGQIIVGVSDPTDYYGNIKPRVTILIKELLFFDSKTKKEVVLKDILLWKVLDMGMPG